MNLISSESYLRKTCTRTKVVHISESRPVRITSTSNVLHFTSLPRTNIRDSITPKTTKKKYKTSRHLDYSLCPQDSKVIGVLVDQSLSYRRVRVTPVYDRYLM